MQEDQDQEWNTKRILQKDQDQREADAQGWKEDAHQEMI